jgi:signal transduction histidine kinase
MSKPRTPFKILVVDDNPKNIQLIISILHEVNYEIGFAMDGRQALEILAASPDYDLILLDIRMPFLDGFEVCKILRDDEKFSDIPIIFLSASHEIESIVNAFESGGVDYVMKPFNTKELLARVDTHLQLRQKTLEVKKIAKELEVLNQTKDKFFSIIAHDLRNPFEGILMMCRNLLSKLPSLSKEEVRFQIELIANASESGHKLLENLLLWSKSQTGAIVYKPVDLELGPTISYCSNAVRSLAEAKNIEIRHIPADGVIVRTDRDMLCHILHNLLTNAIKFTGNAGHITITTEIVPEGVEISVNDSGIGIPESDLAKLFDLDGNVASRPGTSQETGSGLGLILCREFAKKMGGKIRAESQEGKESRFTFMVPAKNL